ncbi:MAG: TetR/AcrR family transcriptional regulator [Rhodospirillales bacterium]|nr:TetR/AcrR family transcriptional regulator [Rhodospirillales bacterium]
MGRRKGKDTAATRDRLLAAAQRLILAQGFAGTTVDDICAAAGLTKGAFFHHFDSKETLCRAAAESWAQQGTDMFAAAPAFARDDPRERVLDFVDFLAARIVDPAMPFGCLIGALSLETAETAPKIQAVCARTFDASAAAFKVHLDAAKAQYAPAADFDTWDLAYHLFAVFEGAMVLAKASGDRQIVARHLNLYREHLSRLLGTVEKRTPRRRRKAS